MPPELGKVRRGLFHSTSSTAPILVVACALLFLLWRQDWGAALVVAGMLAGAAATYAVLRRTLSQFSQKLGSVVGPGTSPAAWQAVNLGAVPPISSDLLVALNQRESRFRTLVESSSDIFVVVDIAGDVLYQSPSTQRILGRPADERVGRSAFDNVHPDDLERARSLFQIALNEPGQQTAELRLRHVNGSWRYFQVTAYPFIEHSGEEPVLNGMVINLRDVDERHQTEELLTHRALHDGLTGLPNRMLLFDRLEQAIAESQRDPAQVGLLLLDLDRFKEVNDTFGHHYGDLVLQETAHRLVEAVRRIDTVARLGGDEFAVVLPRIREERDALNVAKKLLERIRSPLILESHSLNVSGSIGLALYPRDGEDAGSLLRRSDVAMYMAKASRLGVAVYSPEDDHHDESQLTAAGELSSAIESGQLELYFQPQIELASGLPVSAEALVRWNHPVHGLVLPKDFISIAEVTGLIGKLSSWVMSAAAKECRFLLDNGIDIPVAVNLSMYDLHDLDLPGRVDELLRTWEMPSRCLTFEVTEGALMSDPSLVMQVVQQLHDLGMGLSIDDFGTGYSSLALLGKLPVDTLKIDQTFVMGLLHNGSDQVIVRSTIDLAHNLGLKVIAEGVETSDGLDELKRLDCDLGQGYFISRPLPSSAFRAWMALHPPVDRARINA